MPPRGDFTRRGKGEQGLIQKGSRMNWRRESRNFVEMTSYFLLQAQLNGITKTCADSSTLKQGLMIKAESGKKTKSRALLKRIKAKG
jgi:hypothetical protein